MMEMVINLCAFLVGGGIGAFVLWYLKRNQNVSAQEFKENIDKLKKDIQEISNQMSEENEKLYVQKSKIPEAYSGIEARLRESAEAVEELHFLLRQLEKRSGQSATTAVPVRQAQTAVQPSAQSSVQLAKDSVQPVQTAQPMTQTAVQPAQTAQSVTQTAVQPMQTDAVPSGIQQTAPAQEMSAPASIETVMQLEQVFQKVEQLRQQPSPQYRNYSVANRCLEYSASRDAAYILTSNHEVLPNQIGNFTKIKLAEDVYKCTVSVVHKTHHIRIARADHSGKIISAGEIFS